MLRDSHPRQRGGAEVWLTAALLLLAFLPYLNTLGNSFVYDDLKQIVNNPYIRSWRYLPQVFGSNVWSFLGAAGVSNYYRPLMTLDYLVCYQFFELIPFGYHLVNLVWHAGVVLLLFWVTRQLFGDRAAAFVSAALFALHPVHTESVTWVAGVTDLQLAFFYLLTFSLFLKLGATPEEPNPRWSRRTHVFLALSYTLALLSKEIALTLPALATAYEHLLRPERHATTTSQKLGRYGTLWAVAAAYLGFRIWLLGSFVPLPRRVQPTWPEAFLSAFALVAQYVAKLLWPVELCAFYVFRKSQSLAEPRVLAGLAIVALGVAGFFFLRRRNTPLALAIAWFFVTLGPALNARWMTASVFAERYLYLPSVGFCWLVGWLWARGWQDSENRPALRRALVAALGLVCILQAARVVARNRDWRDEETLYTQTLHVSPDAYLMRTNLGAVYFNRGDLRRAEEQWTLALRQAPTDVIVLNTFGQLRARQGRLLEAEPFFKQAIAIRPDFADPHFDLAKTYERLGRDAEAQGEFQAALRLSPLNIDAHNWLGFLLLRKKQLSEAERHFRLSIEALPNALGHAGLGLVFLRRGEPGLAEREFRNALRLDDILFEAHLGLVELYEQMGRWQEARQQCNEALKLAPTNPELVSRCQEVQRKLAAMPPS